MDEPKSQKLSNLFPNPGIKPAAAVGSVIARTLASIFDSEYMRGKIEEEANRTMDIYDKEGKIEEAEAVRAFLEELSIKTK